MATRHLSLQMSEVGDLTDLLSGFEKQNNVRLELRMSTEPQPKGVSLAIVMLAHDKSREIGEVAPLGSVSVICSVINQKHMLGAVTHALYALDFQLAVNELDYAPSKRA